ncbi:MAG: DUF488 family protein [Micromonosporaceae bacterium]
MGQRGVPAAADDRTDGGRGLNQVFTIGHGAREEAEFLGLLRAAEVEFLLDVRRFPGSRRHPQFGRDALAGSLAAAGVRYEWHGETLGGRRIRRPETRHTALRNASFAGYADHMDSEEFRRAVDDLVRRAESGERLAVMCAETLWWRCHRSFVADALVLRGVEVTHLLRPGEVQRHRTHPTLRRDADGWPVYDVPDTLPLDGS